MSTQLSEEIKAKLHRVGIPDASILIGVPLAQLIGLGGMTAIEAIAVAKYANPSPNQPAAAGSRDTFLDDMSELAAMLSTEEPFEFDLTTYHKLMGFFIGKFTDGAATDLWMFHKLRAGAGKSIVDPELSRSSVLFQEQKPSAGSFPLPSGQTLYLVSEEKRVAFWRELDGMLKKSGFYTLIFQLAMRQRQKATGAVASVDRTYTPAQMAKHHKGFLVSVTQLLTDTEKTAIAERVLAEQKFVLSVLKDINFLRKVVDTSSGKAPLILLWSLPEMAIHKKIIELSKLISEALLALANFDPNTPYESQMDKYEPFADALYTAMEELAIQASLQYEIPFDKKGGIASIVQVLESTLSRRSNSGSSSQPTPNGQPQESSTLYIKGELERTRMAALRKILGVLYSDLSSIRRVMQDAGLSKGILASSSGADNDWHTVLGEAAKDNKLGSIISVAHAEYPTNESLTKFMRDNSLL